MKKYILLLIILFVGCSNTVDDVTGTGPGIINNEFTFDIQYIGDWTAQYYIGGNTVYLAGSGDMNFTTNIDTEYIEFWVKKADVLLSPLALKINYRYSRYYEQTKSNNYIGAKL